MLCDGEDGTEGDPRFLDILELCLTNQGMSELSRTGERTLRWPPPAIENVVPLGKETRVITTEYVDNLLVCPCRYRHASLPRTAPILPHYAHPHVLLHAALHHGKRHRHL